MPLFPFTLSCKRFIDPGRTRNCNLLIRSQTRCPLRHRTSMLQVTGNLAKHYLCHCPLTPLTINRVIDPGRTRTRCPLRHRTSVLERFRAFTPLSIVPSRYLCKKRSYYPCLSMVFQCITVNVWSLVPLLFASLRIGTHTYALAEKTIITNYTDKKGNTIFLIYKEIQRDRVQSHV